MTAKAKKLIWAGVRIGVCVAAFAYIAHVVRNATAQGQAGFGQTIRTAAGHLELLVAAFACFTAGNILIAIRWRGLLAAQQVEITYFKAIELTYMGLFFNLLAMGVTGGDVARAFAVSYHTHRKAEAAVSVFVDRALGLMMLIILSSVMCLLSWNHPSTRQIRWMTLALLAAGVAAVVTALSRPMRKPFKAIGVLKKLPFADLLKRVDEAVLIYRHRGKEILLAALVTLAAQGASIVGVYLLALSLELGQIDLPKCLMFVPLIWLVGAIPIFPGGFGGMEAASVQLFTQGGLTTAGPAFALGLLLHVVQMASFLPGAAIWITGTYRPANRHSPEG